MKKSAIPILVVGLAAVVAQAVALVHLLKIGTCASGGPYLIARQCPSGTGGWVLLIAAGMIVAIICMVIGSFMDGGGLFGGVALILWSAEFLGIGLTLLLNSIFGHDVGPGAKSAGYIIGVVFIPMGAIPLALGIKGWLGSAGEKREKRRQKTADATISRVDELQRYGANQARVRITYAVQPADGASFEVSHETNAIVSRMPGRGDRVKIAYDPRHPDRFEIVARGPSAPSAAPPVPTASAVSSASATSVGAVAAASGLGSTNGPTLPWAGGLIGGVQAQPKDQVQQLKQLADLHDRGALTDTEFEVEKAKILAEP
jgi:hypothetical protein